MTLKERIIQAYPSLTSGDIGLKNDGQGTVISFWESTKPKPSDEQVRQWESEVLQEQLKNPPKTEIETLIEKQELMQKAIDDLILGGIF